MKVLLTGISGFVGHHIFQHIMVNTDWDVIGLHRNSIAGDIERLSELCGGDPKWEDRLDLWWCDLRDEVTPAWRGFVDETDIVLHVAANSHVDRSIIDPKRFLRDNVEGTLNLMEAFRDSDRLDKFVYFSTDEVYGNAPSGIDPDECFPSQSSSPTQ
jgi:dTDP-glucose 4,6-dehydratase